MATDRGAPNKHYKDCLKKFHTAYHVDQTAGQTWQWTMVTGAT